MIQFTDPLLAEIFLTNCNLKIKDDEKERHVIELTLSHAEVFTKIEGLSMIEITDETVFLFRPTVEA